VQAWAGRKVEIVNGHALVAYQMDAHGNFIEIPSRQWEAVSVALDSLTLKLQADERAGGVGESHARWRVEAVLTLPATTFVWLTDFQRWYTFTRPLIIPSEADVALWRMEQAARYGGEDLALRLEEGIPEIKQQDYLHLTVIIPSELVGRQVGQELRLDTNDDGLGSGRADRYPHLVRDGSRVDFWGPREF
jgi:hypothetical protein